MNKLLLIISLVFSVSLNAQKALNFYDSKELLNAGFISMGEENYNNAIKEFSKVSRSDTNYALATLNKTICYFNKEEYKLMESSCKEAIKNFKLYKPSFYKWWVKALIEQSEFEQAVAKIKEAQEAYPFNPKYEYLKGLVFLEQEKLEDARRVFQNLIKKHPFHASSYFQLGKMAANEGDFVRAMIAIEMAIIMDRGLSERGEAFQILQDISVNGYEVLRERTIENDPFMNLAELYESEVALKSAYQSEVKTNFSILRQTDLILNQLEYKKEFTGFWMENYVPFLTAIKDKKLIAGYSVYLIGFIEQPNIQKLNAKYKNEIDAFVKFTSDYWIKKEQEKKFEINGKIYERTYHYDGGILYGIGEFENKIPVGDWTYFFLNGGIKSKLKYNDKGQLHGYCVWYDEEGTKIQYGTYKNGELNGQVLYSHDIGTKWIRGKYIGDNVDSVLTMYRENGYKKELFTFKDSKKNGLYQEFSYMGTVVGEGNYLNGELNGAYKGYYLSGKVYYTSMYKNGRKDGPFIKYYRNGQISSKGQYKNGIEVGNWVEYHSNGNISSTYSLGEDGKSEGNLLKFFENNDTARIAQFKKGKLHGLSREFVDGNILYSDQIYKKGILKSYKYYNSKRVPLSQGKAKKVVAYDMFGYKYYEGGYSKKGEEGKWTYYYKTGSKESECTYEKGLLQGDYTWYYSNGKVSSTVNYKDGVRDGYYVSYHINGKIYKEGWYKEGNLVGDWYEYFINGTLKDISYYLDGEFDGYYQEYNSDGTLFSESHHLNGIKEWISFYDSLGNELSSVKFKKGTGPYNAKAVNGYDYIKGAHLNGSRHGDFSFLLPNGKVSELKTYKNGYLHGDQINYFRNGAVLKKGQYKYDSKEGLWQTFYKNGKLKWKGNYLNNTLKDTTFGYFKNGQVSSIVPLNSDGDAEGEKVFYHENGKLHSKVPYLRGFKHGTYSQFDPFGELVFKRKYVGGVLHSYQYMENNKLTSPKVINGNGSVITKYNNGLNAIAFELKEGNVEGVYKKWYSNGKQWMEVNYVLDEENGESKVWYENGNLKEVEHYYYGELNGVSNYYYKNGNQKSQVKYLNGYRHGTCKFYDEQGKLEETVEYWNGSILK